MINRLVVALSFALFLGFLGILLWFVPRLDLGAVILVTVLLTGYDLYQSAGERD